MFIFSTRKFNYFVCARRRVGRDIKKSANDIIPRRVRITYNIITCSFNNIYYSILTRCRSLDCTKNLTRGLLTAVFTNLPPRSQLYVDTYSYLKQMNRIGVPYFSIPQKWATHSDSYMTSTPPNTPSCWAYREKSSQNHNNVYIYNTLDRCRYSLKLLVSRLTIRR